MRIFWSQRQLAETMNTPPATGSLKRWRQKIARQRARVDALERQAERLGFTELLPEQAARP